MDEDKINQLARNLYATGLAASLWDAREKAKDILGLSARKMEQMQCPSIIEPLPIKKPLWNDRKEESPGKEEVNAKTRYCSKEIGISEDTMLPVEQTDAPLLQRIEREEMLEKGGEVPEVAADVAGEEQIPEEDIIPHEMESEEGQQKEDADFMEPPEAPGNAGEEEIIDDAGAANEEVQEGELRDEDDGSSEEESPVEQSGETQEENIFTEIDGGTVRDDEKE